jgi:methylase of polypeptide subunit release factors
VSATLPEVVADPAVTTALAADLTAAGFTVDGVEALWGAEAAAALHRGNRRAAIRAARDRVTEALQPRYTLAALFLLGLRVPLSEAEAALPSTGVDGLVRAGLVRLEDALVHAEALADQSNPDRIRSLTEPNVVPTVDLRPYAFVDDLGAGSWWIVSDLGELALGGPLGEEHVLGIGGASTTLSGLQVPVHVRRVLDLGTGCGIQALHARRFADEVVATDISRRALDIARFNAQLNGVDGIDLRLGSLFDPVAGERFDRIVSNPPFVITPRSEGVPAYEYRDGGMVGDALVETVLRGLGDHLEPGGTAQLLGNWEYRWGSDGLDRVRGWFGDATAGSGLDAWVVEREREDPIAYAETWIRDGGTKPGTPEHDRLVDAWLDDFRSRRVTGVGFGYVVVRRPRTGGAPHLRRFERLPQVLGSNPAGLGATVARTLDAVTWLAEHDDDAFADADTALAAFVGAADGELAVGQIVAAIAQLTDVDERALAADLLPRLRDLVLDGLLLPV